jgi:selenocysteine lyase/cysteine desulfurase
MPLDRRSFLARAGLTATAAGLAARWAPVPAGVVSAAGAPDWTAVRALFNLSPDYIHLASFFIASHPKPVRDAIDEYRRRLDANPYWLDEAMFEDAGEHIQERVKATIARYAGGRPEEIALVPNTTTGLALLYNGLRLRPGQEILTTEHDHYVHHESIRLVADKTGAAVRRIALHDGAFGATEAEMVERLRRAIAPRTRVVGITWVHSSTGLRLPVRSLAEVVRDANRGRDEADRCLLIVDGAHGFGCSDEAAASLGADFVCSGTHKWIFGPRGTGMVWGRAESWPEIRPTVPTFDTLGPFGRWARNEPLDPRTQASWVSPGGFCAYEHCWAVEAAFQLHEELGRARIAARVSELNGRFREGLAGMKGVTLHTPLDPKLAGGIVCFEVKGRKTDEVVARLKARHIIGSASPYAVSYARVAAGVMVTPEEVETTLREIRALAG